MSREDAAASVGKYLWQNRGDVVSLEDITDGTGLSVTQVRGAEQELKKFVSDHIAEFQGYTLYVALGPSGEHGFIQESVKTAADQLSRARYMLRRQRTEVSYTSQVVDRVLDTEVSRLLRRALIAYEGAAALLEDAMEKAEDAAGGVPV